MLRVTQILSALIMFMLAAPKAIGIAVMHYADSMPRAAFGDSPPGDIKELDKAMKSAFTEMKTSIAKMQEVADTALKEVKENGTLHKKTNEDLTRLSGEAQEMSKKFKVVEDRMLEVEQKLTTRQTQDEKNQVKSLEQMITESPEFKSCSSKPNVKTMDPVLIGNFHKTQIVNATGQNQPLVPAYRVNGIIVPPEQRLTIRDLIPAARATSNMIEYARELTFTNAAAPQGGGSPGNAEGELKAESAMTFDLQNAPVITIAHWIPASRQVLADASLLAGHISNRLTYGLKLEEESEILTDNGNSGTINGLINQATAFSYGATNMTAIDALLKGILQVSLSNFEASGIVLHPVDWANIMLLKDTTGQYLFSNPQEMVAPRMWAKPVVATQSMNLGRFLIGAFNLAAQIWDREDATVRISENVNDHFIRNLVAILAEERLALTVYRPSAMVYGTLQTPG